MKYFIRTLLGLGIVFIVFVGFFVLNTIYGIVPEKLDLNDNVYRQVIGIEPQDEDAYGFVYADMGGDVRGYVQLKVSPEEFTALRFSGKPVPGKVDFGRDKPFWWSPPRDCIVYNRGTSQRPTYYSYDQRSSRLFIALP